MTAEEILDACRTKAVRLVRFLYCDNGGVVRGKATTWTGPASAGRGNGPGREIRLVPDADTFTVLPSAPHTAAMLTDHLRLDG
jgi:glutamine synthetase